MANTVAEDRDYYRSLLRQALPTHPSIPAAVASWWEDELRVIAREQLDAQDAKDRQRIILEQQIASLQRQLDELD